MSESDPFEQAKTWWKTLSANKSWSTIWGDIYYLRFPIDVGTSEAKSYKKTIFEHDDSVHQWDATAVREEIIRRLMETQVRTIRPWYGQLTFFSDSIRFLPLLPEAELDFVVRSSLLGEWDGWNLSEEKTDQEEEEEQEKSDVWKPKDDEDIEDDFDKRDLQKARLFLLSCLDPDLKLIDRTPLESEPTNQIEEIRRAHLLKTIEIVEKRAIEWGRGQLELYGLFTGSKNRFFTLSEDELHDMLDFIFDASKIDDFFRKRFIAGLENKAEIKPFIGQHNSAIFNEKDLTIALLGGGNDQLYHFRTFQLWLYTLLKFDLKAKEFIESKKADLFCEYQDLEKMKETIFQAIQFYKWTTIKDRLVQILKMQYASDQDFSGYTNEINHLINSFNDLPSHKNNLLPIDLAEYNPRTVLMQMGVSIIESVLTMLSSQIPIPTGISRLQARLILNKRIANLNTYVLPEDIRKSLIEEIITMESLISKTTDFKAVEKIIRKPIETILPRGEAYFNQLETEVKSQIQADGDKDLRKELEEATDTPQSMVKQYGKVATDLIGRDANLEDLYALMLGLKSTELVFASTTLPALKKQKIVDSMVSDYFKPQFDFMKLIKADIDKKVEKEELPQ